MIAIPLFGFKGYTSPWADTAPGHQSGKHRQRGLGRQRLPLTEQRGLACRSPADQPHPPAASPRRASEEPTV